MSPKPWYPLATPRLLLRAYREEDLDEIHAYACDAEVTRHLPWGPNTREATAEFLARRLEEQEQWPREECTLAIETRESPRIIGGIRLGVCDRANRTADLGYVLHRDYWGKGYMPEAATAVLDAAFGPLGLHRVWAKCDVRNSGSWRVMEKLGMRREGEFVRDTWERGEWCSFYRYAILEEEWRAARFSTNNSPGI